jgi:hypothetical protein
MFCSSHTFSHQTVNPDVLNTDGAALLNTDGAIINSGQTLEGMKTGITVPHFVPFPLRFRPFYFVFLLKKTMRLEIVSE